MMARSRPAVQGRAIWARVSRGAASHRDASASATRNLRGYDDAPGTLTIYYTDKWGPFGYTMTKQ
jgi:hypothetical protein